MKVTFLTPTLELHGGTLLLAEYANRLARDGVEVIIISPRRGQGLVLDPKIKIVTYRAVPVRYLDTLTFQLPYWFQLINLVSETDVLIPIYTPLLLPVVLAKIWKRLAAKILLVSQEAFEMPLVGRYNLFLLGRKFIQRHLTQVVAVSEPMMPTLQYLVGKSRVILVRNGIDLKTFHPRDSLAKKNYLLFVGRPNVPKGYPQFKEVFRQLQSRFPSLEAKVVAPGIERSSDNGLELVPFRDREQLAKLYNQAAVYVCASHGESFGLPALEAMASATAVVTTSTVGSQQYAKDNNNCLVVPVGNVSGLFRAISRILSEKELAARLIKNGLVTARAYDKDRAATEFAALVRQLGTSGS